MIRLKIKLHAKIDKVGMTAFFSYYQPDIILRAIMQQLASNGYNPEVSDKTWKVKFNVEKELE